VARRKLMTQFINKFPTVKKMTLTRVETTLTLGSKVTLGANVTVGITVSLESLVTNVIT
jgi:tetrahydrodipicolinate N-succinyltransferase